MRSPARHIACGFFAVIFTIPLLAVLWLQFRQAGIRQSMKEKLESSVLHTVVLPADRLVWVKKDKEIRIGDHLFDIKTIAIENGQATITGLYDHEERAIEKKLESYHKRQHTDKSTGSVLAKILSALQSVFFQYPKEQLKEPGMKRQYCASPAASVLHPFRKILTPPPQHAMI